MSFLTPEKTVNKKKSVEPISFIPKKVVANRDADKRYPIPHTRIDMRYYRVQYTLTTQSKQE